jgi:hypothetical protein
MKSYKIADEEGYIWELDDDLFHLLAAGVLSVESKAFCDEVSNLLDKFKSGTYYSTFKWFKKIGHVNAR